MGGWWSGAYDGISMNLKSAHGANTGSQTYTTSLTSLYPNARVLGGRHVAVRATLWKLSTAETVFLPITPAFAL